MDEQQVDNTTTELSSRRAAVFSWLEFIGIALFIISRLALERSHWLGIVGLLLIISGYSYKAYAAWKSGNRKMFWQRIVFLLFAIALAVVVGLSGIRPEIL